MIKINDVCYVAANAVLSISFNDGRINVHVATLGPVWATPHEGESDRECFQRIAKEVHAHTNPPDVLDEFARKFDLMEEAMVEMHESIDSVSFNMKTLASVLQHGRGDVT